MKDTGFYDLERIKSDKKKLVKFFKECISRAITVKIEHIAEGSWTRTTYNKSDMAIGNCSKILLENAHVVFIDRKVLHENGNEDFECSVRTMSEKYKDILVFVYLNREAGEKMVIKHQLKIKK